MPNYNYYKTISANMLVTTHDFNYAMGFIKEDEIYNHQSGVSVFNSLQSNLLALNFKPCTKSMIYLL